MSSKIAFSILYAIVGPSRNKAPPIYFSFSQGGKQKKESELNGTAANKRGKKGRRKKKKALELKNFYAHQIKDDKMAHIRNVCLYVSWSDFYLLKYSVIDWFGN